MATPSKINIFSRDARLFAELNISNFLSSKHNWSFQIEMNHDQKLICSAWLVETMFYVAKTYVNFLTFCSDEPKTILVNFKAAYCFFANYVRSDN